MPLEETGGGREKAGDGAFHVDGAASVEHAVLDLAGERINLPAVEIAWRDHIGVSGETQIGGALAQSGVQIVDGRGTALLEPQPVTAEAHLIQRPLDDAERALIFGRDARAADQRLRERNRIARRRHARSSSLIEVLARVLASTRLTITAQARPGPGRPSGSGGPGRVPGTTTE